MAISKTVSRAVAKKLNPAMGMKGFPPNVRSRNLNGALRRTRADKLLKTIRKQFDLGAEALAGHSGNMKLGTLRKMRGVNSEKAVLNGIFGLKGGRTVNANGQIRGKRADTLLKTIREQYQRSVDAFAGHSGQMQVGTIQKKRGISSVSDLLKGIFGFKGGRARNIGGAVRQKRGDTLARTLEKMYSVEFPGRNDKHLKTLRKELGANSIKDLLAKVRP